MDNRKALLLYFALVGLPLLGVVGVLRLGKSSIAPPSISGEWQLDGELRSNDETPCASTLGGFRRASMTISQSGKFLEVTLPNENRDLLRGSLTGNEFRAEARPALFGDDVFQLLRLSGRIEDEGDGLSLHGVLSMPRRVDCVPVPFRAFRSQNLESNRELH
jgi:hypothetical protein